MGAFGYALSALALGSFQGASAAQPLASSGASQVVHVDVASKEPPIWPSAFKVRSDAPEATASAAFTAR